MVYINVKGGGVDKRAIKVIQPAAGTVGADCRVFARQCLGGELPGKNVPDADVAVIDATFFHHEDLFNDLCTGVEYSLQRHLLRNSDPRLISNDTQQPSVREIIPI